MKIKLLHLSIAWSFVLLFLYTGITKLTNYNDYVEEIQASPLLKNIPVSLVWVLPVFEIIVAFMVLSRRWRLVALYSCSIMMVLFTIYLIALDQFEDYIPCSCGGFLGALPRNLHIVLNCILALLGVFGIAQEIKIRKNYQAQSL